jgi:glycosyltransferase involved in cell wall biosynthesis
MKNKAMKILFISSNPFGIMGTPGTYFLVEAYAQKVDICVIANKDREDVFRIVHTPSGRVKLHELSFSRADFLINISQIVNAFDPDIINVTSYPGWTEIVDFLKETHPRPKYVYDIKSPHLALANSKRSKRMKEKGQNSIKNIDLVLTRSHEDIPTWIPQCSKPVLIYPLGVQLVDYSPRNPDCGFSTCNRFVYVGAIAPFRKLEILLEYIKALPKEILENRTFDFFGSGPSENDFVNAIQRLGLEKNVAFKGCVDTDVLPELLSGYDAGIAWVPHELYDASPSLKIVEYTAAGILPIAMDTTAHRRFSEKGFHVSFFSDTPGSFASAIIQSCQEGFSVEDRTKNLSQIQEYDWSTIAEKYILPSFFNLIEESNTASSFINDSPPQNYLDYFSSTFEETSQWNMPLSHPKPKRLSKSKTRIAAILAARLYKSISLECDLLLLTPETWNSVLSYTRPDFLLIESAWSTASGHWHMAQNTPGIAHNELIKIIEKANELGIPTVYWMTLDSLFHEYFLEFSKHFDFVFCADPEEVELLRKDGVIAKKMLPAVQPVLFNSIQNLKKIEPFDAGVLFDGMADLVRFPEISATLKNFAECNLNIYQSALFMSERFLNHIDSALLPFVRGSVCSLMMPNLLRQASLCISFDKSAAGKTQKVWAALEASACHTPIAHLGRLEPDDLRCDLVTQFENESAFCDYVMGEKTLSHSDEIIRHKAWRETYLNHTIAKRLQSICKEIGIKNDWVEFPSASLITGVKNSALIPRCLERYESQTYPNKELIIVFSSDSKEFEHYRQKFVDRDDVKIYAIPSSNSMETLLNYGLRQATGDCSFRFDEGHQYGSNYIMDSMLHLRAAKTEGFGNNNAFFQNEINPESHLRSQKDRLSSPRPIKKVLFIGPWQFAPNVGKKNVRVIYPSLLEPLHGCEFHILHGRPDLPDYTNELIEKYGVKYHCVKKRNINEWIETAVSLIERHNIDVVTNVFFGYYLGYIAAKAAQMTNRKSVVRFAGNELYVRKCAGTYNGLIGKIRYLKERKMEKDAIGLADDVIGMSPWEVKRIKKISLSPGSVNWCMRGIDTKVYAPPREREYKTACDFLYVGRKSVEKGYKLIEKVAHNLYSKYPDIRFYFAGNFEQGEEENRSYLGYCSHEHLKKIYFEYDALILPSESEGFANVIVEAMSMGMPCIISESFHQEYFKHKENAMLTKLTIDDIEKNVIEIHNDITLYKKLSLNARALALKEFDSKKWSGRYREIIVG